MTETTHTQSTPSRGGAKERSPEFRLAVNALRGLWQDMFQDALVYRPLPRRHMDGPLIRKLPPRIRERAVWAPHAVVVAAGLLAMLISVEGNGGNDFTQLLSGLCSLAAVLLTLARPVGAFWASMAATLISSMLGSNFSDWPWIPGAFATHLVVLTVVALRTRPRIAAWMWGITALYSMFAETFFSSRYDYSYDDYYYSTNTGPMLTVSAFALLFVSVLQIRRTAAQEVTAQLTVTAHERSRRTLLEERTTIARELHDVVAHHMSVVAIQAEAAPYRVENPPPELEQAFVTIRENAVAALTELRRVLGVVRAEDYEAPDAPQPTLADLDGLLANVREAGLTVDKVVTGAVRELPQGVELSAYRIVQEALSNTLRHAPGATARVEIAHVLGGLGVRIVNGPSPEVTLVKSTHGAGHGLTGMRERVTMLNGEMATGETDDGGYEVTVFLPVATMSEADA
ncbi:sensor histidine kinase [Streptomyces graminofaciens]|uniref:sensor histidine kinase n=1 Tax=Streptomyces graminofaciens TaxID=68212 RepID=UPI002572C6E0|nr:histidine kinase [Streptomyces graminofaciens]